MDSMQYLLSGYHYTHDADFSLVRVLEKQFGYRYCLILMTSPNKIRMNNSQTYYNKKNTLIFFQSGSCVEYGGDGEHPFVNDWLEFFSTPEEIEELNLKPDIIIHEISQDMADTIGRYIDLLAKEYKQRDILFQRKTNNILEILLIEVSRYCAKEVYEEKSKKFDHKMLEKIKDIQAQIFEEYVSDVQKKGQENRAISEICFVNGISESHFRKCYKEIYNTTINRDIMEKRINTAQSLIFERPDLSMVRISQLCGYRTHEHFFRQFRKLTEMSPVEFKNRFFDLQSNLEMHHK